MTIPAPDLWSRLGDCAVEAGIFSSHADWAPVTDDETLERYGVEELDRVELAIIAERLFMIDLDDGLCYTWDTWGDVLVSVREALYAG